MMGWDFGWGWGTMMFGGVITLVVWGALIALVVLAVRSFVGPNEGGARHTEPRSGTPPQTPLEILQSRYAKGEISRDEFETIRRDLQASDYELLQRP
jgi:putative membrane protein